MTVTGLRFVPRHQKIGARLSVLLNIATGPQDHRVDIQLKNKIKIATQGGYDRRDLHPGIRETRTIRFVDDQFVSMAGREGPHPYVRVANWAKPSP